MTVQQKLITSAKKGLVEIIPKVGTDPKNRAKGLSWAKMHVALRRIRKQLNNGGNDYVEFSNGVRVQVRKEKADVFKKKWPGRVLATIAEWWRFVFRKIKIGGGFNKIKTSEIKNVSKKPVNKSVNKTQKPLEEVFEEKANPIIHNNPVEKISMVCKPFKHGDLPYKIQVLSAKGGLEGIAPAKIIQKLQAAKQVTIGDLHGSFLKFFETLELADFVDVSETTAKQFKKLAKDMEKIITKDQFMANPATISRVSKIYDEIKPLITEISWKNDNRQLILIGDVIADRGPLDLITLDMIEHLAKEKPSRIISIIGNHDQNAQDALRYHYKKDGFGKFFEARHDDNEKANSNGTLVIKQMGSLYRSFKLLEKKKPEEFENLAQKYKWFLNHSKLMAYSKTNQNLFTHAPIEEKQLINILKIFKKQKWINETPEEFLNSITPEKMEKFSNYVNHAYKYYLENNLKLPKEFEDFLWTRSNLSKEESIKHIENVAERLIHGHDNGSGNFSPYSPTVISGLVNSADPNQFTVINLDQSARKHLTGKGSVSKLFIQE